MTKSKSHTSTAEEFDLQTAIFCPHLICKRAAGFTGVKGWKIPWSPWFKRAPCDITERYFHWLVGCFPFINRESPNSTLGCVLNVEFDAVGIQKGPTQQAVVDFSKFFYVMFVWGGFISPNINRMTDMLKVKWPLPFFRKKNLMLLIYKKERNHKNRLNLICSENQTHINTQETFTQDRNTGTTALLSYTTIKGCHICFPKIKKGNADVTI